MNSNISLYDSRKLYNKSGLYYALEPTAERVSPCRTHQSERDGRKIRCEPHNHQSFGAGGKSEHYAQQLHITAACCRHGTTSERFVARTANAANGIKTDKQVYP